MKNLEREIEMAYADYAAGRIDDDEMDRRIERICKERDKQTIKEIRRMRDIRKAKGEMV